MATIKLTVRSVDAAIPQGRDFFLWDDGLRGFGLKVTKSGGKIFVVQYRMGGRGSATRRYTIGNHGVWTPALARAEAERLLRLAASGTDPLAEAKARERAHRELAFARYVDNFLEAYGQRNRRPGTYASAKSNFVRWIVPVLGNKALPEITRRDIIGVIDRVPASKPALPRNIFVLMRKLFNWAAERGDIERSPMDAMRTPKTVPSRERALTDEELFFLLPYVEDIGAPFSTFIRFLVLTGQRRSEVAGMKWDELDRDRREWTIPNGRTKNKLEHTFPLSNIVVSELDALAGGARWPRRGLVLTTTGNTPISGFSKIKRRLDAILENALHREVPEWRFHDLRRTFATNLQRLGVRWEVNEALLNHVSGARSGVAGIYQRHDWSAEMRDAVNLWNDKLVNLLFAEGHAKYTDGKRRNETAVKNRSAEA